MVSNKVLERALTPHFSLCFWLAAWLPPGKCRFIRNKRALCLGSRASLRCETGLSQRVPLAHGCPKDLDAQSSPPPLFLFIGTPVPTCLHPAPNPCSNVPALQGQWLWADHSLIHTETAFLRLQAHVTIAKGWEEGLF